MCVNDPRHVSEGYEQTPEAPGMRLGRCGGSCCTKAVGNVSWARCSRTRFPITGQFRLWAGCLSLYFSRCREGPCGPAASL